MGRQVRSHAPRCSFSKRIPARHGVHEEGGGTIAEIPIRACETRDVETAEGAAENTMPNTHLEENIGLIAKHEQEFRERRTSAERIGDSVAGWMGSLSFVVLHLLVFAAWILVNGVGFSSIPRFDPPPFQLLGVIFAFEALLLASFVLMRQSRIGRRADERNHLELQVLLLTEKEITAVLSLCQAIAQKLNLDSVATIPKIEEMKQDVQIDEVAETIRENLSKGDG
jgi:uncharacterized membrane protein